MATKAVMTPIGIASFITLKEPRAIVEGNEPRFSITLIFDKAAQNTKQFKELEEAIEQALMQKWPNKATRPRDLRSPFRDGGEKEGIYEGYKRGDIFINPWSQKKPGVVDINRQDLLDLDDVFAGWTARANVRPFAYDRAGKRGVGLFLDNVQFLREGKRLDGRKAASESYPDDQKEDAEEMI